MFYHLNNIRYYFDLKYPEYTRLRELGNANIAKYFIASGTGKKEPSKILNELEKWERARLDPRAVPVDLPCGNMKELTSWKYTSSQNILILSEVATFVILAYRRL